MESRIQDSVLIVDDEPMVRESIAVYLGDSGFRVFSAEDGREGLRLFREVQPHLVICDLRMPAVDGLDLLRIITQESPSTPVIVVSGQGDMADVVSALRLGACDYLFKPLVELEVLEHSVRRALERGQLMRENLEYRQKLEMANRELERSLDVLEEDQEAGRRIQLRMLPETPLQVDGYSFSHCIIPSLYLSGDFIDYFRLGEHRMAFYLADVSGHGASSAFITVFLKTLTTRIQRHYERRKAVSTLSPARLLASINQELIAMGLGKHLTMFCGVIDLLDNRLTYCVGAHFPQPILVTHGEVGQEQVRTVEGMGLPIGLFAEAKYEDIEMQMPEHWTLVAMSDGVLEVMEGHLADKEARLLDMVRQGHRSVDALTRQLSVSGQVDVPDDIAILVVER